MLKKGALSRHPSFECASVCDGLLRQSSGEGPAESAVGGSGTSHSVGFLTA